jgi:WD40 repeat protein
MIDKKEKDFNRKRIFISYGHGEHISLVLRLRDDLLDRGHSIWFDEDRLQAGHDFESKIEEGIEWLAVDKENSAFLLLLTPHSVRRPDGYCLNEVARALAKGLRLIPLMVVDSEPPLSICRIQWLDMRECIPIHEKEAYYKPRFERLLKAIEENQLDFEGTQQRFIRALQPLEFDAEILNHVSKFTGRRWVFDALKEWMDENPPRQRVFWITGSPGIGKTAISAVLSNIYPEVAALHLCKFGHAQKSDPRRVVTSIVYQLATQLTNYEARLAIMDIEKLVRDDARTMFDNLLVQPLTKLTPPPHPLIILIDALDEATRNGRNELAGFIASEFDKTPDWLRLIITSRTEKSVVAPLQGLNPFILDTEIENNRADILQYLKRELDSKLTPPTKVNLDHIINCILNRSEGIFLYVEHVCDDIRKGRLPLEDPESFPQDLGGIFWQFFERQFPDYEKYRVKIRPALRLILSAFEPLPLTVLQGIFRWQEEELWDFTRELGSLFLLTGESGSEVIRPYHRAVTDWLTNEAKAGIYFVSMSEGHLTLANFGWEQTIKGNNVLHKYFVLHLVNHLVESKLWEKLETLLTDISFLEIKASQVSAFDLVSDFTKALIHLPKKRESYKILLLLKEALMRDLHFIARYLPDYPHILFQCLWNLGWWYDSPESADHYLITQNCKTNLPWDDPGPKLSQLLDYWRSQHQEHSRNMIWIRSLRPPAIPLNAGQTAVFRGHDFFVASVVFSPDGRILASGSDDRTIRLWDTQTGASLAILRGHKRGITQVAFSPDGKYLASGSRDRSIRLWEVDTGKEFTKFKGHEGAVTSVLFTKDNRYLISGSNDRTIRIWDLETREEFNVFRGHEDGVTCLSLSNDGLYLVSGSEDRTIRLWQASRGKQLKVLKGHDFFVTNVVFSPDGRQLASGSRDHTVRLWEIQNGKEIAVFHGHEKEVTSVAFHPDGSYLASGSNDKTIKIWNPHTGVKVAEFLGHEGGILSLNFSSNGFLASGSSDHTIRIWDAKHGEHPLKLKGHENAVTTLAFSLDGRRLASGSWDHTIRLWDAQNGKELAVLQAQEGVLTSVAFSPDGRLLAGGSNKGIISIWETGTTKLMAEFIGHEDSVSGLAFSPDGSKLASGSDDFRVRLWGVRTNAQLAEFSGHERGVTRLAFSPDSNFLASASRERKAFLWDVQQGICLKDISYFEDGAEIFNHTRQISYHASVSEGGTAIRSNRKNHIVARLVNHPDILIPHPNGRLWAMASQNQIQLIALECLSLSEPLLGSPNVYREEV